MVASIARSSSSLLKASTGPSWGWETAMDGWLSVGALVGLDDLRGICAQLMVERSAGLDLEFTSTF